MSQLFESGSQSIGVSDSTSVLPMNTQDWSPLEWTGWISLQSKGFSRVFSNTRVQKHQFFSAQLSLWSNSHVHTWLLMIRNRKGEEHLFPQHLTNPCDGHVPCSPSSQITGVLTHPMIKRSSFWRSSSSALTPFCWLPFQPRGKNDFLLWLVSWMPQHSWLIPSDLPTHLQIVPSLNSFQNFSSVYLLFLAWALTEIPHRTVGRVK